MDALRLARAAVVRADGLRRRVFRDAAAVGGCRDESADVQRGAEDGGPDWPGEREKRADRGWRQPDDKEETAYMDEIGKTWRTSKSLEGVRKMVRLHMPAVYKIAEARKFNNFILLVIALNTVVMMTALPREL